MAETPTPPPALTPPKQISRHVFAVLAVLALGSAVGLWYYFSQTTEEELKLGAGLELKYRAGLTDILCEEALKKHLTVEVQWTHQTVDAIDRVNKRELDAAIVPAGISIPADKVRQVTMMDCEALHLFAKPEICAHGLAGLRGRLIFLGAAGSGAHCVANEVLQFVGLTGGTDYVIDTRPFDVMMKSPPNQMPDAFFCLSPLPSPFGDKLVRQFGYQLMDLPMGEALSLRKPCYEDILIPADTYGANPTSPQKPVHTVGIRGVLIANKDVASLTVERLLEVLFESDFTRRSNLKKMDPALLQRPGDYPDHPGTMAYIHRADPWIVQKVLSKVQGFIGSVLSVLSAILLAWQWIRRKKVEVGPYQQECTTLDLEAQRAAYQGSFGEMELNACMTQLSRMKAEILEQYHQQYMSGDKATVEVVTRIEGLQHLLPSLVRSKVPPKRLSLEFGPPKNRVA